LSSFWSHPNSQRRFSVKAELFKLAPEDVLTTEESAKLLAPFITPLPSFYEMALRKQPVAAAVGRR